LKDAERRRLRAARAAPPDRPVRGALLFTDGGARPNPGPAAFAYVVESADGRTLASEGGALGRRTVAAAEMIAIARGLRRCAELGLTEVEVRSDARAVLAHLLGDREFRNPQLVALGDDVQAVRAEIGRVRLRWIERAANTRANALVESVLLEDEA
jgi:ribonuclease HI